MAVAGDGCLLLEKLASGPACADGSAQAPPESDWGAARLTKRAFLALAGLAAAFLATAATATSAAAATEPAGVAAAKIDPALGTLLAAAGTQPVRVVYVLRDPPPRGAGDERRDLDRVRAALATDRQAVADLLARLGQQVVYASPFTGMIVAAADGQGVAAAAADPRVVAVYPEGTHRPRLNVSKQVTQATIVHARGVRGAGARVAVVEDGTIDAHPALPADRRILCTPGGAGVSDHKTEVAGVIQSGDPSFTGMAPQATLIDAIAAEPRDAAFMAATDCAVAQGAVAVNMSFGSDTDGRWDAFADYVDRLVYRTGVTVVVAVSNQCGERMGSPEIAFNDISVGAFSDRNTLALADDRQTCDPELGLNFSAYRDPPSLHGDRQQPDVVAPGDLIHTTSLKGSFEDMSGTSFAAPHVTGEVALLQSRAGFSLAHQAERVRAIIMASARHNLEGAARLSDRDGAGGIRLAAADSVLRAGNSWWFSTPGAWRGFPHVQTFRAQAGQSVRVALVWAHKPGGGHATVSTDLNLWVLDPAGRVVAGSASLDNNFEIAAFVANVTGAYTIRVNNARPSAGTEHVGLAVSLTDQ